MDLTPEHYCREIESYLCRKNDGHLIRIVGPAFEQVCGWAARGVPLNVAQRGIDRYFERYYAKGPRRRPVRVEFCEADVLDVFDQWRRAVGVPAASPAEAASTSSARGGEGGRGSLPSHLERVIARLTSMRAAASATSGRSATGQAALSVGPHPRTDPAAKGGGRALDEVLDAVVRELDAARATATSVRGEARERLLERLQVLDAELLAAARALCDEGVLRELDAEAAAQLAPFRERLAPDAYERSREACIERGVRERFRLPLVAYDG